MGMIFPGMDPYLEDPQVWPGVHNRLVVYLADQLQPRLQPNYVAMVEERVYIEGTPRVYVPDVLIWQRPRPRPKESGEGGGVAVLEPETDTPIMVRIPALEVHESYVAIRDKRTGRQVVTVIELVSPSNKYAGPGRDSYLAKQREVRASQANLVELDLLRTGPHVLAVPEWAARGRGPYDYLVCVNRAKAPRDEFELYPRGLRDRLPRVRIPLAGDDPDTVLDLQAVLAHTYDAGLYRELLSYDKPCVPPLAPEDQAWADSLIREAASGIP
jgi:Protein of unknown function (DUF4058)